MAGPHLSELPIFDHPWWLRNYTIYLRNFIREKVLEGKDDDRRMQIKGYNFVLNGVRAKPFKLDPKKVF
jgi:hypothetical protein